MKTIAFYSYKGGVGRSLAVSHVAYWLSREGKSVFLLDMDMEAPGLHYKLEQYNHKITPTKGLVDFIGYFNREDKAATSLKEYVIPLESTENKMAPMWLMPAGDPFASNYWKQLSSIEWKEFLYQGEMLGSLLFLELKALIEKEYNPDFLLIDSRTGLNDLTGIGMNLLADDAVILGVNNPENIDGSRIVMEKLRRAEKLPFKEAKTRLHFVLTRIPAPETKADSDWEEKLKLDVLTRLNAGSGIASGPLVTEINIVHIDPEQAKEERNRFKENDWNKYPIAFDYDRLAEKISNIKGGARTSRFVEIVESLRIQKEQEAIVGCVEALQGLSTGNPVYEHYKGHLAIEVLMDADAAIAAYSNAIDLWPEFAEAFNSRGVAFQKKGSLEKAFADFSEAIVLNPDFALAYSNRGVVHQRNERHRDAIVDFDTAIRIDPKVPQFYHNRGLSYGNLNKFEEAREDFDRAISLGGSSPDIYFNRAIILTNLKEFRLAIEDYDRTIVLNKLIPESLNGKAYALFMLGKLDDALYFLESALFFNKEFATAYGTLSEIHSALGNTDEFYISLEKALYLDPNELNRLAPSTIDRHENEPRFQELLKKYKKA